MKNNHTVLASPSLRPEEEENEDRSEAACFACGRDNPQGLQMQFAIDADGAAVACWATKPVWSGFQDVTHGGILCTAMDEAMAKAIMARGMEGLTCELRVRLRRSVHPGDPLLVRGWIVELHHRLIRAEASICSPDGKEYTHAWASFLVRH